VVDPERLHRILRRVTDDLAVLQDYAVVEPAELLRDPVRLGHIKYLFVTLLEGCIDAAQHVAAAEGYGPADTNAASMLLLARHHVLTAEVATAMAQAVRFRNVLVHGYVTVDDRRVVDYLRQLTDVEGFTSALALLIAD
jgi:uncharacterized protein YutE (UPF0331/DUF86 family)